MRLYVDIFKAREKLFISTEGCFLYNFLYTHTHNRTPKKPSKRYANHNTRR